MPEIAPDMGFGEVAYVRVTDPELKPARSWTIVADSMVDGLNEVKDEAALGQDMRPAPPNYDYKPGNKSGSPATTKEN